MRAFALAVALAAGLVFSGQPAECYGCSGFDCIKSSACPRKGCFCAKRGLEPMGFCAGVGVDLPEFVLP